MKPKPSENKAKDVETKTRHIPIPDNAKAEIRLMEQSFNTYLAGVVAGLGIKGKWRFDRRNSYIVVEDK